MFRHPHRSPVVGGTRPREVSEAPRRYEREVGFSTQTPPVTPSARARTLLTWGGGRRDDHTHCQ